MYHPFESLSTDEVLLIAETDYEAYKEYREWLEFHARYIPDEDMQELEDLEWLDNEQYSLYEYRKWLDNEQYSLDKYQEWLDTYDQDPQD